MAERKKRIILDCDLMKHPHSGLYHYCLNLGKELHELLKNDETLEIALYVPPAERNTFGAGAKTIIEKKGFWNFFNPVVKDCSIWHAPFQSGRILPDKRKYPDIKILLTIHDLNPLHEGKSYEEQQKSLAHTQTLIDKSDALVCISDFTKSDVLKHCNVKDKPVYVIHNGTHKVHEPQLENYSYRPARPFVFGMGYINRKKNYHVLLPLLENESIEMVIAGRLDEPDYVNAMLQEARKMGVADRLHLTGPVSEGEKAWYFKNCLAFVHPSLAEGFGAPVVEVMQFGKPLFLSSYTSLPEIAGDTAFYFQTFERDHLKWVFDNGLTEYSKNGLAERIRKRGQLFDWKQKAKEYLSLYKEMAAIN